MENGYYWIKVRGRAEWTVGVREDERWYIVGHSGLRYPSEISEVGTRIPQPQ